MTRADDLRAATAANLAVVTALHGLTEATERLAAEQHLTNQIAVLGLGMSALELTDEAAPKTEVSRARARRLNAIRVEVRKGLSVDD